MINKLKKIALHVFFETPRWAIIVMFIIAWLMDKYPAFNASLWMLLIALLLLDILSLKIYGDLKYKKYLKNKNKKRKKK